MEIPVAMNGAETIQLLLLLTSSTSLPEMDHIHQHHQLHLDLSQVTTLMEALVLHLLMMTVDLFQTAVLAIGHGHQMTQLNGAPKTLNVDANNDLALSN